MSMLGRYQCEPEPWRCYVTYVLGRLDCRGPAMVIGRYIPEAPGRAADVVFYRIVDHQGFRRLVEGIYVIRCDNLVVFPRAIPAQQAFV